MAVSDYKTDPNENTTISGINIAEGCAPSGINNAIRQLMADVKADKTAQDTATAERVKTVNNNAPDANGNITPAQTGCLPLTGGTMTGPITFNNSGQVMKSPGDDGVLRFDGGSDYNKGAFLSLHGMNYNSNNAGAFQLSCRSSTFTRDLVGHPDGTLRWGGSQVLLPAGAVFAFAANSKPEGCLFCNGAAVSRTTYAALFAAIGTTYGSGDGSTTFNLPNLKDKFIQGSGTAGTVKAAGLPNITGGAGNLLWNTHIPPSASGSFTYGGMGNGRWAYVGSGDWWSGSAILHIDASLSSSIYGNSSTIQPPALTMRYYIKY